MDLEIFPIKTLSGKVKVPPSKSYSHRAFFIAGLAEAISVINNPLTVGDVEVTINALKSLGVKILKEKENKFLVNFQKSKFIAPEVPIDCKNSGTTFRILCALGLLLENGIRLTGEFLKRKRPIQPLLEAIKQLGAVIEVNEDEISIKPVNVIPKRIKLPGDVSSQFITALLLITPLLKCKGSDATIIELTTPLTSHPYIYLTLDMLDRAGITIKQEISKSLMGNLIIPCSQNYRGQVYDIPGDFSSAAYIFGAATLAENDLNVIISNLDFDSPQGDREIISYLREMGANILINPHEKMVKIKKGINKSPLEDFSIDCRETPDLFPILAVMGCFTNKVMKLTNIKNIRSKESDRVSGIARELKKMGANLEEHEDQLIIKENTKLNGADLNHGDDHRIAMALIVAAMFAESNSYITNVEIIEDSYPTFIEDLQKLGAHFKIK